MGLIFDKSTAKLYHAWHSSPQGRAIDKSVERLLSNLLDAKPGERVLDIGCGAGNHLIMLSKMGLNVCGVDAASHMIDMARERLGHRSTLEIGMAEDLPFDDNEFDYAVMINTLEYLENPILALREAGRVASKKVFVSVLNSLSWNGILKKIQGYLGDPLFGQARFFSYWQLKSLLHAAFGRTPMVWECIPSWPSFIDEMAPYVRDLWNWRHSPFGCSLGISATMVYRLRTNTLPLKVRLKKASQSLMGARPFEDVNHYNGAQGDERGLPL
jgi:ubiquinone/menaquinone biosynthesis C-methylase UbiE